MSLLKWFLALSILGVGPCGAGCSLVNQHGKEFDTLNAMASKASDALKTSGTAQYAAGAHGINPGIRVGAGIEYFAFARYEGLAGQFTASASGKMQGLTTEQESTARLIATSQYLTDAQKSQLLVDITRSLLNKYAASQPADNPHE